MFAKLASSRLRSDRWHIAVGSAVACVAYALVYRAASDGIRVNWNFRCLDAFNTYVIAC